MYARYTRISPVFYCKKASQGALQGLLYAFYKFFTFCENNLDFRKL